MKREARGGPSEPGGSADTHHNTDGPREHWAESEKPTTEGHVLYCSIYMTYPQQANPQTQTADQWLPGCGGEGNQGMIANGYQVSFWFDKNVLELVFVVAQTCECSKNH